MLAVTRNFTYLVMTLHSLFIYNSQFVHTSLFVFNNSSFSYSQYIINGLHSRLLVVKVLLIGFSGHNFRRKAAQYTLNNGMLNKDIQKLGHWTNTSFCLYFVISTQMFYNLNINFQTD